MSRSRTVRKDSVSPASAHHTPHCSLLIPARSTGAQPNDVLLLYFGFALPSNEYDVVSFTPQDLKVVLGTTVTGQETDRFFVTRHGVDPRLSERISSSAELAALCKHRLDRLLEIENKYIATEGHERSAASRTHTAAAFRYVLPRLDPSTLDLDLTQTSFHPSEGTKSLY